MCSRTNCKHCGIEISKSNILAHEHACSQHLYPKKPSFYGNCIYCGNEIIGYDKKRFCNRSCAAKHNNSLRPPGHDSRKQGNDQRRKFAIANNKTRVCPIGFCLVCKKLLRGSRKICADGDCYKTYRSNIGKKVAALATKRSADEMALAALCKSTFRLVITNEQMFNGWDADIILPDFNIAILWNGPWHYKEMRGLTHSLEQVKNRDRIKIHEIEKAGWEVLIFEDRHFSPETAFAFLNITLQKRYL